ncbi:MAG: hypothetical protein HYU36_17955 [Planctomycetes bacterium]|nr:hypothetical protein [Planctomycetota bacterium]
MSLVYKIIGAVELAIALILLMVSFKFGTTSYEHWEASRAALRGLNLIALREFPAAKEQFENAIRTRSDYVGAHEGLLYLAMVSKPADTKGAKTHANDILTLTDRKGPRAAGAYIAYGVLKTREAAEAKTPADRVRLLDAAEVEFQNAQKADPDNADAWINRGILELIRKDWVNPDAPQPHLQAAFEAFSKARNCRSVCVLGLYPQTAALGRLYFERNEHLRALEEMAKSAELDPEGVGGLTNYGVAYGLRLINPGLAEDQKRAMLQKVDKLIPATNPAHYFLQCCVGSVYFSIQRFEESKLAYSQLANDHRERGTAFAGLAALTFYRYQQGANKGIKDEPISTTFNLLHLAESKGDLTPGQQAWCYNVMALCRREGYPFPTTNDPKPVQSPEYYLRKAIELDPNFWIASRNLGVLHQEKSEWKDALLNYRLSDKANPAQEEIRKAIKTFEEPPQVSTPQLYPKTVTTDPDEMGITTLEVPAFLVTVQPSYPGKVERDATRIWIDNTQQTYWEFLTDNQILVLSQESLLDGKHEFRGEFVDAGANVRPLSWPFAVDLAPPSARFLEPKGDDLPDSKAAFLLELEDSASRVEFSTFNLRIQGSGTTARVVDTVKKGAFQYDMPPLKLFKADKVKASPVKFMLPASFPPEGEFDLFLEVRDRAGLEYKNKFHFKFGKPKKP